MCTGHQYEATANLSLNEENSECGFDKAHKLTRKSASLFVVIYIYLL